MAYGDDIGVWGNKGCRMRPLLTDPKGGSPTLGDWVRFPSAAEVSVKGEVTSVEGEGDNETWTASNTKMISGKAMFSRECIPGLKVLLGGSSAISGSTPNQEVEWQDNSDRLPKFELEWYAAHGDDAGGGDSVRTLHKVVVTSWDLADKFGETSKPSFEFKAERRKSDGKRFTIKHRETGSDIVEGAPDQTPPSVTGVTPADGANNVPTTGVVTFTFGSNVKHSTASDPGNYYYANGSSGAPIAFQLGYDSATRVATLTPTAALTGATKHVAGVSRGVRSVNDVRMAASYGIDFTTV